MTSAFGRISENLLFSLLIAVFAGWTVVSVAARRVFGVVRDHARVHADRQFVMFWQESDSEGPGPCLH